MMLIFTDLADKVQSINVVYFIIQKLNCFM